MCQCLLIILLPCLEFWLLLQQDMIYGFYLIWMNAISWMLQFDWIITEPQLRFVAFVLLTLRYNLISCLLSMLIVDMCNYLRCKRKTVVRDHLMSHYIIIMYRVTRLWWHIGYSWGHIIKKSHTWWCDLVPAGYPGHWSHDTCIISGVITCSTFNWLQLIFKIIHNICVVVVGTLSQCWYRAALE